MRSTKTVLVLALIALALPSFAATSSRAGATNAVLTGLTPSPLPLFVESLVFDPTSADGEHYKKATVTLRKAGAEMTIPRDQEGRTVPELVLEMSNGKKWTFLKVKLTDILISGATGHETESMTLNFTKATGPRGGY